MRSDQNDKHFIYAMIYDLIIQLFLFLMNMVELKHFGYVFFKINTGIRFHLLVNYTVGNPVLRLRSCLAVKLNVRLYIRRYTS